MLLPFLLFLVSQVHAQRPIVSLEDGEISGDLDFSYAGRAFSSFRGVPYAKPPIDRLRFALPQRPDKWDGVMDCGKEARDAPVCAQMTFKEVIKQ